MARADSKQIAESLIQAITAGDEAAFAEHVAEDVVLLIWDWQGREICRPRARVFERLAGEWSQWDRPHLDILEITSDGHRTVVEFQVFTSLRHHTEHAVPVEHNRMLTLDRDEQSGVIGSMNLYCAHPVASSVHLRLTAERDPAPEEFDRYLAAMRYSTGTRRKGPKNWTGRFTLDVEFGGTGNPHPSANAVKHARLGHLDSDAIDARIAEIIEHHRRRDLGFSWLVSHHDTPADLGARLEAHGLVHAGQAALMVRPDLPTDGIPCNPDLEIQSVGPGDREAAEAALQIVGVGFQWDQDRLDEMRQFWFERFENPEIFQYDNVYLGRLDGKPAGFAAWTERGGVALLDGAATLPEFRRRQVYATLLRRRIEDARAAGYTSMVVEAQPMSRRVLARHGFEVRGLEELYAWMPVMDVGVIDSLIQHDGNQPDVAPTGEEAAGSPSRDVHSGGDD